MIINIPYVDFVLSTVALGQFHRHILKLDVRDNLVEHDMFVLNPLVTNVYPSYLCGLFNNSMQMYNNKWSLFRKYGFDHPDQDVLNQIYHGLTRLEGYHV